MSPAAHRAPVVATRPMARRRRRRRALVAIGLTAGFLAGAGYGAWHYIDQNEYLLNERCEVHVGETVQELTPEQTHHAARIALAAIDRGLPPQAAADVIGFALQETGLTPRAGGNEDEDPQVLFARSSPNDAESAPDTINGVLSSLEDSWEATQEAEDSDDEDEASTWSPELSLEEAAKVLNRPHNAEFYSEHEVLSNSFAAPLTGQRQVDMTCEIGQLEAAPPAAEDLAEELANYASSTMGIEFTEAEEDNDDEEFTPEPIFDGVVEITGAGDDAEVSITVPETEDSLSPRWMVAHWALAAADDYGVQSVTTGSYRWERDTGRWSRLQDESFDEVVLTFSR